MTKVQKPEIEEISIVQGFEIPTPLANKLTKDAVWVLGHLWRYGAAIFEIDDGLEDATTIEQLARIAQEGYFYIHNNEHVVFVIADKKKFRVKLIH